ncbi:radical SAM/SPASM domain-containing protein [Streptomyces sp. NPDC087843]|uniref:radical SAM/SPASM domain-containing protein n=1 Tax=Streptomyces sp. NPDC087843 TaxID=3365804 RepID=UPI003828C088
MKNAGPTDRRKPRIDLIWSLTLVCPWDCPMCSVDAVHVRRHRGHTEVRSRALTVVDRLSGERETDGIYVQAARWRQSRGLELNRADKMRVLDHLTGYDPKIDFSGGDPMVLPENVEVLAEASSRFGRHNITLTATGAGLINWQVSELAPLIGELNFTFDSDGPGDPRFRPTRYAGGNLRHAARFAEAGVKVRAECPLTIANCAPDALERMYLALADQGVGTLLLMRLFPVGRGATRDDMVPTRRQYLDAIDTLRRLEAAHGTPRVRLQCALRHLEGSRDGVNPCDLLRESFGLLADGTLLASPWALDSQGAPLHDSWVLGSLAREPLGEILSSERPTAYRGRLDENFGQCKVFAYLHSELEGPAERMFDRADPLYRENMPGGPHREGEGDGQPSL